MSKNFSFAILFPLLAIALIALYGGGLGVTFIVLREVVGIEAVIVLGGALVILVPVVAYLLTRNEPVE